MNVSGVFANLVRRLWSLHNRYLVSCALILIAFLGGNSVAAEQTIGEQKFLYVVALANDIYVYDINNGHALAKTIHLPGYGRPRGVQASVTKHLLYVSYLDTPLKKAGLAAIDLTNDTVAWVKLFPGTDALAITPDEQTIFMSSGEGATSNYFYVIDAATGVERGRVPVYQHTHNGLVNLAGDRAYLSSTAYRYLVAADTTTLQPVKQIGPFGDFIRPFTVNGRSTLAFVNVNHLQGFEVGDLTTGKVLYRVVIPGNPNKQEDPSHGIGMTPDERELWVAGETNYVYIFDATQLPPKQIGAVKLSRQPKWVSMSIDGRYIYPGSGDVVDRASRTVIAHYHPSKRQIEVDFAGGVPVRAGDMYAKGQLTDASGATATPTATVTATPTGMVTTVGTTTPTATPTAIPTPAEANGTQKHTWLPIVGR